MTIVEHRAERTWRGYRVYREPEGGEYADVPHTGVDLAAAGKAKAVTQITDRFITQRQA